MTPASVVDGYRERRRLHPDQPARVAWWGARNAIKPKYLATLPYEGENDAIFREVPGLGVLRFCIYADNDHSPYDSDGQMLQWKDRKDTPDGVRGAHAVGADMGDGWYSLDHWDRQKVYCIKFTEAGGGDLEGRRAYRSRHDGMSRHEAHCRALASIRKECGYWQEVAQGKQYVGLSVQLRQRGGYRDSDRIIREEECWGYEYDDTSYLLSEMNSWAESLVEDEWKKRYGSTAPAPEENTARYRKALGAYATALATSNDDFDIADQVFAATYKDNPRAKAQGR